MTKGDNGTKMNWDLTSFFPEFGGKEMVDFKASLRAEIDRVKDKASRLTGLSKENQADWEGIFLAYEGLIKRFSHINSYVGCLASADSNNEGYLKEEASLSLIGAEISKLEVELFRALKGAGEELFAEFSRREGFDGCRYHLERIREEGRRMMAPELERLTADLGVDGLSAWGRLYDKVSAKLEFEMDYPDGRTETLPMANRRSLLEHPDRRIREAAFRGGNEAWQRVEDVASAALNAISGTRLTLNRYRGVEHFLDIALFQAAINKKSLDAMLEAIYSEIELPRTILKDKAKTMGESHIKWYDLGAPLPIGAEEVLSWNDAKRLVASSFESAYPALSEFLENDVYEKNWIDWEPRPGKRPGGFCTGSMLTGESRIFMTYNQSLGDVLTLAHEVGHAFHNNVTKGMRPFAQLYPMTLAESASTFAEMILAEGILSDPSISDGQKALMLDMELGHGAIYLLDITVRFEFEKALHEERASGELSVSRLKDLMVETQRKVFGDVLAPGGEDPYFWASKLHFYIIGVTFYNFPYTFGYLLSRGLFAIYKKEGEGFFPRYEKFLALAGSDTAPNVARRTIGVDLENPEFWAEAIHTLYEPQERYSSLVTV